MIPKKTGDTSLAVCDKKAQAWRLYLKRKSVAEIAEVMGISKRSVYRYVKGARDKAVLDFEEMQAKEAGAEAKAMYDLIKRETFEQIRVAQEQHDDGKLKYKDFAYIWNTLMDKVRLTQMSEDTLLGKTGVFEGDKASVTVNILQLAEQEPRQAAEGFMSLAKSDKEAAQYMMDILWRDGTRPTVEGEVKVLEGDEE